MGRDSSFGKLSASHAGDPGSNPVGASIGSPNACMGGEEITSCKSHIASVSLTDLLCDMIVIASDVNKRNTRHTDSLNIYMPKSNIECYQTSFKYESGKICNDLTKIYRMLHQWRHLNMLIRNLILDT